MSILSACILAVLTGAVAAVAASVLKMFLRLGGDDSTLLLALLVAALISSFAISGGIAFGALNEGIFKNAAIGVLIWFFSGAVLLAWAVFILSQDASDAIKRIVAYGLLLAFLSAVWLGVHKSKPGAPVKAMMKLANKINAVVYEQIAARVFPEE